MCMMPTSTLISQHQNSEEGQSNGPVFFSRVLTFTTHSYARLVMNLNTYQMMSTYFEHIRPCYREKSATETMTPFFLTKQGEQWSNSQFDKVVKRMTGRDISLTKNRKQSVTNRKRSGASEQELKILAEHMTHSVNTQKGYYDTDTI